MQLVLIYGDLGNKVHTMYKCHSYKLSVLLGNSYVRSDRAVFGVYSHLLEGRGIGRHGNQGARLFSLCNGAHI